MITSLTGSYAPLGTNDKLGAEQAVNAINAAGGIDHRKIDLTVENDQTNPSQAVLGYATLISDGVSAIVGPIFSSSALAIVPNINRNPVPTVMTSAPVVTTSPPPYVFNTPPANEPAAQRLLTYMKYKGWRKIEIAHDTTAFGMDASQLMSSLAPHYGVKIIGEQSFSVTATDFTAVLQHVRASGARALMVYGAGPAEVTLTKQYKAEGFTIPLLFSGAESTYLYTQPVGAAGDGVIIQASMLEVGPSLPAGPERRDVMRFVHTFEAANHYYPPLFAGNGYDAVELIAAAIRKSASTDPKTIDAALNHLTLLTPEGTYKYTPTDHTGLSISDVSIMVDRNGKLVPTHFTLKMLGVS